MLLKTRWIVLERDGYRCRYCGRGASDPGVILEVDHITPRAAGGGDEPSNLATSCWECNHGKSDRLPGGRHAGRRPGPANHPQRKAMLPDNRVPTWGMFCWMPLGIACVAYVMGDAFKHHLELIERRGFPTPPGPRTGGPWVGIVRDDPGLTAWTALSLEQALNGLA